MEGVFQFDGLADPLLAVAAGIQAFYSSDTDRIFKRKRSCTDDSHHMFHFLQSFRSHLTFLSA